MGGTTSEQFDTKGTMNEKKGTGLNITWCCNNLKTHLATPSGADDAPCQPKKAKRAFSLAYSGSTIEAAEKRPTNPDTFEGKEELLKQKREQARRQAGNDLISNYAGPDTHMRQWEVSGAHFNIYY